jgi:iron-sulfur cluster assembly protein
MITLTESAQKKITSQLNKRGKGIGIRIGVKTTGCSGLAYVLEFVDSKSIDDHHFDFDKFSIFIDPKSFAYLNGMNIDFVRNGLNEGFSFGNPNERDRCGCGESFRI